MSQSLILSSRNFEPCLAWILHSEGEHISVCVSSEYLNWIEWNGKIALVIYSIWASLYGHYKKNLYELNPLFFVKRRSLKQSLENKILWCNLLAVLKFVEVTPPYFTDTWCRLIAVWHVKKIYIRDRWRVLNSVSLFLFFWFWFQLVYKQCQRGYQNKPENVNARDFSSGLSSILYGVFFSTFCFFGKEKSHA